MNQFEQYLKYFMDDENADEVRFHVEALCDSCPAREYCDLGMCVVREAADKTMEIMEDKNGWLYRMYA